MKEQEKKLEVQEVSGGLSDNQLIEVEQLAARMKKRLADLVRQVDRLDKNGEIASQKRQPTLRAHLHLATAMSLRHRNQI